MTTATNGTRAKTMKKLLITLLLISPVSFADMPKAECRQFKKENKMVLLDMTRDEAFCIVKKAKLVKQYKAQNPPNVGKLVEVYQHVSIFFGIKTFAIIDDKVVHTSKI